MKIITKILLIVLGMFTFSSCLYNVPVEEVLPPIEGDVIFSTNVVPIFETQECTNCHNSSSAAANLNLLSDAAYTSIINRGLVDMADPANSRIYKYPSPTGGHYKRYTSEQALFVLTWIEQGALNN